MRPATGGRRQPKDSFNPPPTPLDFHQRHQFPRDSDASFASSRPSSVGGGRTRFEDYKDRHFQQSVVSTINSFLSSHNFPISFKSTTPSARDILETLRFLLSLIDFPSSKLEEDLPPLLKRLNYPFKLNKSILKSPAAPHQWPSFLALIHWLVQIASFNLHLSVSTSNTVSSLLHTNLLHQYTLNTYIHYIRGDDDAVEDLDRDIMARLHRQKALAEEKLEATNNELKNLRDELERLRSQPLRKDELEKTKVN